MDLLLQFPGDAASRWHAALADAMPDARIVRWPDVAGDVDHALVWKPPAELFLRVRVRGAIFNLGAGVDALMRLPTLPAGVPVIRLTDAGMAEQMAEYVVLAVLRAFREIDAYAHSQRAAAWAPRDRLAKDRFRVGLLGMGVLGRTVARTLQGLGFPVSGWSTSGASVEGVRIHGADALPQMLADTRVLVCLLPSTPATRGILDRARLSMLPRGAHVVNVARGDLVVDEDLLALLDEGHLASATLDVFREEPLPADHPFWHHRRIAVTPHVSAATLVEDSVRQVAAKIAALARGEPVDGVVERGRGY